jgi:hypothetical protein
VLHGVLRLRHDPSDVLEHYGVTQPRMVQIRFVRAEVARGVC